MIVKIPWFNSSTRNQYIAALSVNIITVIHGCAVGWTSPMIPYLKSDETHLNSGPITPEQASWIGSLISIGALSNIFIIGKVSEFIGKKKCLLMLCLPNLAFWLLTSFSTNVIHLYIARAVAGLTGGGLLRILPMYIGEISESHVRGALGYYLPLGLNFGIFLIFVLGAYMNYFRIPFVLVPFLVVYFILVVFLPETPQHLIKNGKDEDALKALKFYRSCNEEDLVKVEEVKKEFELLKKNILNFHKAEVKLKDFLEKSSRRGLFMSLFVMFIATFSGNMTFITYTADIFKDSGSSLSANESSIIIGCVQFVGIYIASTCVDKFGRKILMGLSCFGSGFSLSVFTGYSFANLYYDVPDYLNWIPIVSLSFTIFFNSIGITTLPFVLVTELVPQKIREASVMIFMACITIFAFTNLKIFPPLVERIQLYGCMAIYSGFCLLGTLVTVFIMPETKGKNLFQSTELQK